MRNRTVLVCLVGVAVLSTVVVSGQAPGRTSTPRTPDGKPDLQGIWDFRTVTPMERPAEFANKPVLTEKEAADYERRITEQRNADSNRDESKKTSRGQVNGTEVTADVALAYNDFWWDRGTKVVGNRRTSLIVDPPDGRIPALTPAAQKRLEQTDDQRERLALGPEDRSVGERCILGFNSGPPMIPGGYNQNVQIVQTKDNVVVFNEMVHSARVVPMDGRPRSRAAIGRWMGDPRGHWEGDTLVVDTVNFSDKISFRGGTEKLHLVERFTRLDADTLEYRFTVDDPDTWTTPWTVAYPMVRTTEKIYEYACHEGNYGLRNILSNARWEESEAARKKQ